MIWIGFSGTLRVVFLLACKITNKDGIEGMFLVKNEVKLEFGVLRVKEPDGSKE